MASGSCRDLGLGCVLVLELWGVEALGDPSIWAWSSGAG